MIQSEAERQFYLGRAGIRMWYARAPLPGAAPSPEYDFGADEPEVIAPVMPVPAPTPVPPQESGKAARNRDKIARLQTLMESVPTKAAPRVPAEAPVVPKTTAPAESTSAPAEDATEDAAPEIQELIGDVPRLSLQAWVGRRIVLVANLSDESSLALQETLARNILRSLGETAPAEAGVVHWPLFNNLKISLNSVDNLVTTLKRFLRDTSGKQVIVLGDSGPWVEEALEKPPEVRFPGPLARLASDPALKRELWQLIKPLAAT